MHMYMYVLEYFTCTHTLYVTTYYTAYSRQTTCIYSICIYMLLYMYMYVQCKFCTCIHVYTYIYVRCTCTCTCVHVCIPVELCEDIPWLAGHGSSMFSQRRGGHLSVPGGGAVCQSGCCSLWIRQVGGRPCNTVHSMLITMVHTFCIYMCTCICIMRAACVGKFVCVHVCVRVCVHVCACV